MSRVRVKKKTNNEKNSENIQLLRFDTISMGHDDNSQRRCDSDSLGEKGGGGKFNETYKNIFAQQYQV